MIPAVFRRATEPDPEAVRRLERSFSGRSARSRLALLPAPPRALSLAPRSSPRWRLPALAAAIVALLWWFTPPPPPVALRARLEADQPVTQVLTSSLSLTYAGLGTVEGDTHEVTIHWQVGELALRLEPGTSAIVETDEGTLRASDATLRLTRDARGTVVAVERGQASLSCVEGPLKAPRSATCLPRRPAGLLARARALRADRGAALEAVERGLSLSSVGDPVRGELLALQVELLTPEDPSAAAATARRYLAEGYQPRAEAMKSFLGGAP